MAARELTVLGTASQAPTRTRNHNACFLRWDAEGILFDPGEGTQRQLLLAGLSASDITHICITHFHGDHCLGLPGVLQRLSLEQVAHPVQLAYPASGAPYLERLRHASVFDDRVGVEEHPVTCDGIVEHGPTFTLRARRLDHEPDTFGWRIDEPEARSLVPALLASRGVRGSDAGTLKRTGRVVVDGRTVLLDEVSVPRAAQSMAFVMDTGICDAAVELAAGVDLLVCEATFTSADEELARRYRHLTAAQAARLAAEAGARRLVLTHFSQRYPDASVFLDEAAAVFPDVVVAHDLLRVSVPPRRHAGGPERRHAEGPGRSHAEGPGRGPS